MSDNRTPRRPQADEDLEREIRHGRKFTLEEAVARMAGPGSMKGESPVARLQQCQFEIDAWLRDHLSDAAGALETVLRRQVNGCELLLENLDQPLASLGRHCRRLLESDYLLADLVREADAEWGRAMGERPYFDKEGAPRHPDDPYTIDYVRDKLASLLGQLDA